MRGATTPTLLSLRKRAAAFEDWTLLWIVCLATQSRLKYEVFCLLNWLPWLFFETETLFPQVYDQVKLSIEDVLQGFNSTIFAYGQTGSGKSHTMFGQLASPEMRGIIPRACHHIFEHISNDTSGAEWQIKSSVLEIYLENVKDLLTSDKTSLRVRETPARGVWVDNLTEEFVTNESEVLNLLQRGEKNRTTSSTSMNETSSRSHSLFVLTVVQKLPDGSTRTGKLNLGDLAGSEKVGKTGATGTTLEEAKKINQSLSALGNCINALTKEGDRGHVPYRDSKLTFILRESLGGNTKTTLIVACSPHSFNMDETVSTLRFAQRAKSITNQVTVNQKRSVEELELIVKKLLDEVKLLKKKLGMPESERGNLAETTSGSSGSIEQMSADLKRAEEQGEELQALLYDIAGLKKELSEAKTELAEAKRQEESFNTARAKWEYDQEQLRLQLESEISASALATDRAAKVHAEKEALVVQMAQVETEMAQGKQRELHQARAATEELEAVQDKLRAVQGQLNKAEKAKSEAAESLQTTQKEKETLAVANRELETRLRELETAAREKELVESSLKQELSDLSEGTSSHNEDLTKLRAELLQRAKEGNVSESRIRDLTERLQEIETKFSNSSAEIETRRECEESLRKQLEDEAHTFRQQMQFKMRELAQRDAMHEEVLYREAAKSKKTLQEREAEVRQYQERLMAARDDLDNQQSKYLLNLKQAEQRNKRIHSLEEELVQRNALIKELKEDIEAAVQLNIDNAGRFQEELVAMEKKHKQAAERRKATIVRSIVGAPLVSHAPAVVDGESGSASRLESVGAEFSASGWFAKKMPNMNELTQASKSGYLAQQEGRLMKSWRKKWYVLNGKALYYFESATDQKPKGMIEMGSDCIVQAADEYISGEVMFSFGLFHPNGKLFFLQAESASDREAWMEAINKVLL